ncbi:MAG: hypothetical protein WB919_21415 [Candidatus Sulfotelmatobacter sp.]
MASKAVPNMVPNSPALNSIDQRHWKRLFEGSLTSLNGGTLPIKQQPIFLRQNRANALDADSSKAALSTAAASLAALWQISTPKRPQRSE